MKLYDYSGYELHRPTSGGKAGKGYNKTSTIQVRKGDCIVKQFKFELAIFMDKERAINKAKNWIEVQQRLVASESASTTSLTALFTSTLTARGYSSSGAEGMAKAFLAFDSLRHCSKPDPTDPTDRENVEAFVEGVIYKTKLASG